MDALSSAEQSYAKLLKQQQQQQQPQTDSSKSNSSVSGELFFEWRTSTFCLHDAL